VRYTVATALATSHDRAREPAPARAQRTAARSGEWLWPVASRPVSDYSSDLRGRRLSALAMIGSVATFTMSVTGGAMSSVL
jgi:hypothetical protein